MGCNCKKKYDAFRKYSDTPNEKDENGSILGKIILFLAKMVFGILLTPLIIVIMAIFVIYVIICMIFGIEPNIVLKMPFKQRKKNKTDTID